MERNNWISSWKRESLFVSVWLPSSIIELKVGRLSPPSLIENNTLITSEVKNVERDIDANVSGVERSSFLATTSSYAEY